MAMVIMAMVIMAFYTVVLQNKTPK